MSLLDGIKNSAGRRNLKRELKAAKRQVSVMNYGESSKIGILYLGDDEKMHKLVRSYVKHLKEEEGIRKIMALSYFSGKILPAYLQAKLSFDFFTKKELNWHQRPSGTVVNNFVNEEYDILIDLSPPESLPLRFILVQSKARFKVGMMSDENQPYYDFLIDIGENQTPERFIEQVNHYLKILNNSHGK